MLLASTHGFIPATKSQIKPLSRRIAQIVFFPPRVASVQLILLNLYESIESRQAGMAAVGRERGVGSGLHHQMTKYCEPHREPL